MCTKGGKTEKNVVLPSHRYIYRIDNLMKATTCNNVGGGGGVDCQIPLLADFDIFEIFEKERKRVERERCSNWPQWRC
jgi:hypothetical protein